MRKRDCNAVVREEPILWMPVNDGRRFVSAGGRSFSLPQFGRGLFPSDHADGSSKVEVIAIGILVEQAPCDPKDDFVSSPPKFDGGMVRIGNR